MRATFDKDASIRRLSNSISNRILGTNLPSFTDRFPMLAFRWKSRGSNNYIKTKCVQLLTKMPALEGCQCRFQIAYSAPTYRASQTDFQCWHFDENREAATTILTLNACNFWQRCQHWKVVKVDFKSHTRDQPTELHRQVPNVGISMKIARQQQLY